MVLGFHLEAFLGPMTLLWLECLSLPKLMLKFNCHGNTIKVWDL